jgi:hypothetical protein
MRPSHCRAACTKLASVAMSGVLGQEPSYCSSGLDVGSIPDNAVYSCIARSGVPHAAKCGRHSLVHFVLIFPPRFLRVRYLQYIFVW